MFIYSNKALSPNIARKISASAKLLSDPTRVEILLFLLACPNGAYVQEIAAHIGSTHSATSHQLARLHRAGLVDSLRRGQYVRYHVASTPALSLLEASLRLFH